ncbi:MAG TPA: DsbA family protein [Conexibacter sp.]|jgi:2-hydroxychromene-2-carboxylate isomerase|nr:DsbA family protein [Conexibacter sp.]
MTAAPRFFVDVGSPYAWLAAERIEQVLPLAPVWEPVLLGAIFAARGSGSWAQTDRRAAGMAEVERRASAYGLPPVRWPDPWPGNMLLAMRAATAAAQIDAAASRAFLLAALRLGFRDGRDLSAPDAVADAARAAGLDAERLLAAAGEQAVKARLRECTDEAVALGVCGVPTVVVGTDVFWGDDRLEQATAALRRD